jgi:SEC-C motif-containing protein
MTCPCNPKNLYAACCKIAHNDIQAVTTAEQLMRSRYSAFALADVEYLQRSHHSSLRPSRKEARELKRWTQSVEWIKLEILQSQEGSSNDETGAVEFKAFYLENGSVQVIHEHSKFCKDNGHWVYLDAV